MAPPPTPLSEARRRLREAIRRRSEARRRKLWLEDELAWRRLHIAVGVWRARIARLKRQRDAQPQQDMFGHY